MNGLYFFRYDVQTKNFDQIPDAPIFLRCRVGYADCVRNYHGGNICGKIAVKSDCDCCNG